MSLRIKFRVCICVHILGLLSSVIEGRLELKNKFIVLYDLECEPASEAARAIVTTDMPEAQPFAVCADDKQEYDFLPINEVQWELSIYFTDNNDGTRCAFLKNKTTENTYYVDIYVPEHPKMITFDMEQRKLECIYKDKNETLATASHMSRGIPQIKQMQEYTKEHSKTSMRLYVTDIFREELQGSIRVGRGIRLNAEMLDSYPDERSFQVISCRAFGGNISFTFLRGGCGVGQIIPKHVGFYTYGRIARSVHFPAFRLPGTRELSFSCSYVICKDACDGSSCYQASTRTKREAMDYRRTVYDHNETALQFTREAIRMTSVTLTIEPATTVPITTPVENLQSDVRKDLDDLKSQVCFLQTEVIIALGGPFIICIIGSVVAYFFFKRVQKQMAENRCCSSYSSLDTTFLYKLDDSLALSDDHLDQTKMINL